VRRLLLVLVVLLGLVAITGLRWSPRTPSSVIESVCGWNADRTQPEDRLLAPLARRTDGSIAVLGTDELGRPLGLRLWLALGTSLAIAGAGAAVAVALGTAIGTTSGLAGGRTDAVLMRLTEVTAGVPAVLVIMVLVAALRDWGAWLLFAGMGLLFWQSIARLVRARVLRLKAEPYVEAARALGAPAWHRIRRHVLPGVWPTVGTAGTLLLPRLILLESLVAYLGVSGDATPHSFGRIIAGVTATLTPLSPSWWPVIVPCVALACAVLVINLALDQDDLSR